MTERPITPVTITDLKGQERKFLLSQGGIKRLKERYGAKKLRDLMVKVEEEEDITPILCEAMLDSEGRVRGSEGYQDSATEAQLADLMPVLLSDLPKILSDLFRISLPEPRPTVEPNQPTT